MQCRQGSHMKPMNDAEMMQVWNISQMAGSLGTGGSVYSQGTLPAAVGTHRGLESMQKRPRSTARGLIGFC